MKDYNTYLVKNVGAKEFNTLKENEQEIIDSAYRRFNDVWQQKIQGIKTTFMYNPSRSAIGIFIEKGGKRQLVIERTKNGLSKEENAVVDSLNSRLEERLEKMRLPNEEWVNFITE